MKLFSFYSNIYFFYLTGNTKLRHKGKENGVQPALLNGGVLRDYQITGFEWLKVG